MVDFLSSASCNLCSIGGPRKRGRDQKTFRERFSQLKRVLLRLSTSAQLKRVLLTSLNLNFICFFLG
jgi:hypothetical protein